MENVYQDGGQWFFFLGNDDWEAEFGPFSTKAAAEVSFNTVAKSRRPSTSYLLDSFEL